MKLIRLGDKNNDVKKWQYFLIGQNIYTGFVTGLYDEETLKASKIFQKQNNLEPDGIIGNKTIGFAMILGFGVIDDVNFDKLSENWPAKPKFDSLVSNAEREKIFGKFSFKRVANSDDIIITDNWAKENIIIVDIPQLKSIKGSSKVSFHKKGANQLKKLWSDWEKAGLIHKVITWEGSYNPRFVRGSKTTLSNHAFGSAFDINYAWNKLGAVPALVGQKGSVRELVGIANDNGFYWGGHFSRLDGMHFEIAKIK